MIPTQALPSEMKWCVLFVEIKTTRHHSVKRRTQLPGRIGALPRHRRVSCNSSRARMMAVTINPAVLEETEVMSDKVS